MLKKGLAFLTTVFATALLSGCANKDYKESQTPAQSQNNTKMAEEKAKAEAEAKRKAEEEARRKAAEAEAKRKAEEEARRKAAEAEAKRKAEEARKKAEEIKALEALKEPINKIKSAKIATGQATLSSEVQENLDLIAEFLKKYPNRKVIIKSYTDSTGSEERNLKLSQERANNVKNYLLSKGIDENRIEAKGFGEAKEYYIDSLHPDSPINRRTEIEIN